MNDITTLSFKLTEDMNEKLENIFGDLRLSGMSGTFSMSRRFPLLQVGHVYTVSNDEGTYQMKVLEVNESDGITRQYKCQETWGSFRKRVIKWKHHSKIIV